MDSLFPQQLTATGIVWLCHLCRDIHCKSTFLKMNSYFNEESFFSLYAETERCHLLFCSVQIRELQNPDDVFDKILGLVIRLAEHGLIHCDFNEFNIMVKWLFSSRYYSTQINQLACVLLFLFLLLPLHFFRLCVFQFMVMIASVFFSLLLWSMIDLSGFGGK